MAAYPFARLLLAACLPVACTAPQRPAPDSTSFRADSLRVWRLLERGDSLYAQRSGMDAIGRALPLFDSANRLATRLADTALMATSVYYIGNVYNAWNGDPMETIRYYERSASLFATQPALRQKYFYVRYIIAHAYDGEKARDSSRCIASIRATIADLRLLPQTDRDSMDFLPDLAWVSTNSRNFSLADSILREVPRGSIRNNPATNNYLDHYYISRARIDIDAHGRRSTYLDSLAGALPYCNNSFDSAYYLSELARLHALTGDHKHAYQYLALNDQIRDRLSNSCF